MRDDPGKEALGQVGKANAFQQFKRSVRTLVELVVINPIDSLRAV